jgi:hypothetical protein
VLSANSVRAPLRLPCDGDRGQQPLAPIRRQGLLTPHLLVEGESFFLSQALLLCPRILPQLGCVCHGLHGVLGAFLHARRHSCARRFPVLSTTGASHDHCPGEGPHALCCGRLTDRVICPWVHGSLIVHRMRMARYMWHNWRGFDTCASGGAVKVQAAERQLQQYTPCCHWAVPQCRRSENAPPLHPRPASFPGRST